MADVEVGQVRRERPSGCGPVGGPLVYRHAQFEVLEVCGLMAVVSLGGGSWRSVVAVEDCPLWPSEHEQFKDARGCEVRP